jgi:hypothetical protein
MDNVKPYYFVMVLCMMLNCIQPLLWESINKALGVKRPSVQSIAFHAHVIQMQKEQSAQ